MITLINTMTVIGDLAEFRRINTAIADYMGAQPGARRFQLLRSTTDPHVFVEVAEWESAEHHRSAISTDTFRERVRDLPKVARVERGRYEVLRLDEERTAPVSA